jgi:hypothetical protein
LHEHFALFQNSYARVFQRASSSRSVREEKVSDTVAVDDESAAAFDAHSRAAQRVAHFGQSARSILHSDG